MKILSLATDGNQTVLINQAPYRGGSPYHKPVWLSTLRFASTDLESVMVHLNAKGDRFPNGFEILERRPVASRICGPKSRYRNTLTAMRDELGDHLTGNITLAAHDDENAVPSFIDAFHRRQSKTDGWHEVEPGVHVTSLDHLADQSRFDEKALFKLIRGGGVAVGRRGADV